LQKGHENPLGNLGQGAEFLTMLANLADHDETTGPSGKPKLVFIGHNPVSAPAILTSD
jgi:hypothetical protein